MSSCMLCLVVFQCLDSKDEEGGGRRGSEERGELGDETSFFALRLL